MGCSASAVLLLRSVGGADCGHMCSRQDQISLDAATPTLEGYTATASPLTIIVMVTDQLAFNFVLSARRQRSESGVIVRTVFFGRAC